MYGVTSQQRRVCEQLIPLNESTTLSHFTLPRDSEIKDVILYKENAPNITFVFELLHGQTLLYTRHMSSNELEPINVCVNGGIYAIRLSTDLVTACVIHYKV